MLGNGDHQRWYGFQHSQFPAISWGSSGGLNSIGGGNRFQIVDIIGFLVGCKTNVFTVLSERDLGFS